MTKELHEHVYDSYGFLREFGTVGRANALVPDVESRTIDRIILTRMCKCGRSQAFNCGPKDEMRKLLTSLKGK